MKNKLFNIKNKNYKNIKKMFSNNKCQLCFKKKVIYHLENTFLQKANYNKLNNLMHSKKSKFQNYKINQKNLNLNKFNNNKLNQII